ncbi:MAG: hypothetical protein ACI8WM_001824 [Burkholderiaceae bacterium]|jgi:hypothetical protein
MLRAAFKMALRQTEGSMASILTLMNPTGAASDRATVSRRSRNQRRHQKAPLPMLIDCTGLDAFGVGQWLETKPGAKSRQGLADDRLQL